MRRDTLEIGPAVPGALIRIALVTVVGGAVWLLQPGIGWQVIAVIAAAAGAIMPQSGLAWFAMIVIPIALVTQPIDLWRTCLAVLAVHLGHVLATLALTIPARSRVALRVLIPSGRRFLAAQLPGQAVAMTAALLPSASGAGLAWLAPIGALGVALLAVGLLRRAHR